DLGIPGLGCRNELLVEELQDSGANLGQLSLDLGPVLTDDGDVVGVAASFLLLLDGGNDPPGGASGADDVLVCDREEVPFLDGELVGGGDGGDDGLHELHHLLVALGLLGELRQVDIILTWGRGGHGIGCCLDWKKKKRYRGFERL
ncbi:hypothetical protein Golob_000421, partial [Gossypium lobatum]|nr:hypothetical protein [Gossypium lobatum]